MRTTKRNMIGLAVAAAAFFVCLAPAREAAALDAPRWVAVIYIDAQRAVGLRWNPIPGASGYKVLRSTTAGGGYAEIASPAQPQYFDKATEVGTQYFYVLKAIAGAEASGNSEEKSVTIPGKKVQAIEPPKFAKVVPQDTTEFGKTTYRVGLVWNAVSSAIAYNIYRSATPGGDAQLLSSVSETQYADATVEVGKTYYYTLTALDGSFQETPRSAEEKAVIEKKVVDAKKGPKIKLKVAPRTTKLLWSKVRGDENNAFNFFEPFDVEYAADTDQVVAISNNTYEVYVLDAKTGAMVKKFGTKGNEPGQFLNPIGLGLDGDGNVVVSDQERNRLIVFTQDGKFLREIVPVMPADYLAKYPAGPKTMDVVVNPKTGDYFVCDFTSKQILVIDGKGKFIRLIGTPGTPGALQGAGYVRFGQDGNLVVLDMAGTRIVTFNPEDGAFISSWGERKAAVDGFIFIGGFDFDKAGNFVIGDRSSSMVRGFNPDSRYLYNLTNEAGDKGADMFTPKGIAIDSKTDTLFVVEGLINRVQAFRMTGPVPPPQAELGMSE
ncbi:MAG: hypothetical protein ACYC9Y_10560 [Candidatus Methylomirabilia bacterium]